MVRGSRVSTATGTLARMGFEDAEGAAARLLEAGVVLMPGSLLGAAGTGYARLALVPTVAECERAAERIATVLGDG